jgi:TetR/AcrR family transcriptional regulator, repressor of fatR-cypB operon
MVFSIESRMTEYFMIKHVSASAPPSRKEREKKSRQQDILRAARELFATQGYHATTLEDIAHHAEFGKGTIYNYFASKEELFCAIMDQLTEETVELARSSLAISADSPREKLTAYARAMVAHARDNADLFYIIGREMSQLNPEQRKARIQQLGARIRSVLKILAKPLEQGIQEGKLKSFDAFSLAALFDSMLRSYCANHFGQFKSLQNDGIEDAVTLIVTIFFDGITERNYKG